MRHPIIFIVLLLVAPWTAVCWLVGQIALFLWMRPKPDPRKPTTAQRAAFEAELAEHGRRLEMHGPTIPLPASLR